MDVWDAIATERRRLADDLEQLTPEQWKAQSQCDAWDVHHAATHTVMPLKLSSGQFFLGLAKAGFNPNKMNVRETAKLAAEMSPSDIIQALRDNADNRWEPPVPGVGAEIPLSEIVVHGQDIRRPLGIESGIPQETIDETLALIKNEKRREDFRRRISG